MSHLLVQSAPGGVTLTVRVTPRAHRSEIVGIDGQVLRVKLCAPPVEGAANAALRDVLAKALGIRASAVTIVSGHASRVKRVRVQGVTAEQVQALAIDSGETADA
jgi:uncharacterized protein (TIGR00251 family)